MSRIFSDHMLESEAKKLCRRHKYRGYNPKYSTSDQDMYEYIRDMSNERVKIRKELDSWKAQILATKANERFPVKDQTTLNLLEMWFCDFKTRLALHFYCLHDKSENFYKGFKSTDYKSGRKVPSVQTKVYSQ